MISVKWFFFSTLCAADENVLHETRAHRAALCRAQPVRVQVIKTVICLEIHGVPAVHWPHCSPFYVCPQVKGTVPANTHYQVTPLWSHFIFNDMLRSYKEKTLLILQMTNHKICERMRKPGVCVVYFTYQVQQFELKRNLTCQLLVPIFQHMASFFKIILMAVWKKLVNL